MPKKRRDGNLDIPGEVAGLAKDVGKVMVRGFGLILGIGAAAAIIGGAGGGIAAAIYGLPVIGFAIAGAVVATVAVFALWLIVLSDY